MKNFILDINNLQFSWPKSTGLVLDIAEIKVEKGEKIFIKGSSGAGKTTLLSLIGGINSPQSGEIKLLQKDIVRLSSSERDQFRSDHIGFIFQMFNLIPYLSVFENITLPCHFSSKRLKNVLQDSKTLKDEVRRLLAHLKLEDKRILEKSVGELSVGQQQRVATARALLGKPEIIIADEPTSALDSDTRESFLHLLMQECKETGSSLLFVSHDSALEKHFDRTMALNVINKVGKA